MLTVECGMTKIKNTQIKKKERREQNLDAYRKRDKEYYENNKEAIKAKASVKTQSGCGSSYTAGNRAPHLKSKKHQDWAKQQEEK